MKEPGDLRLLSDDFDRTIFSFGRILSEVDENTAREIGCLRYKLWEALLYFDRPSSIYNESCPKDGALFLVENIGYLNSRMVPLDENEIELLHKYNLFSFGQPIVSRRVSWLDESHLLRKEEGIWGDVFEADLYWHGNIVKLYAPTPQPRVYSNRQIQIMLLGVELQRPKSLLPHSQPEFHLGIVTQDEYEELMYELILMSQPEDKYLR